MNIASIKPYKDFCNTSIFFGSICFPPRISREERIAKLISNITATTGLPPEKVPAAKLFPLIGINTVEDEEKSIDEYYTHIGDYFYAKTYIRL